jgi:hypothetical protein
MSRQFKTFSLCQLSAASAALFFGGAAVAQSLAAPAQTAAANSNPALQTTASVPSRSSLVGDLAQNMTRKWSFYWGWNFETYSRSTIHFRGDNHNFTLHDVSAEDKQKEISLESLANTYLNPGTLTIPQTNARLAYQTSEDTAIALNLDHMKYVVTPGQVVQATGTVKGKDITGLLTLSDEEFGHYEHTDGLNILSVEFEKQAPVQWFGPEVGSRLFYLAGAGIVIPKSNVTLTIADRTRNDKFHIAGYSFGLGSGLEVDFWQRYFVRSAIKVGYVNLPDVVTSSKGDKASQHFTYTEFLMAAGVRF